MILILKCSSMFIDYVLKIAVESICKFLSYLTLNVVFDSTVFDFILNFLMMWFNCFFKIFCISIIYLCFVYFLFCILFFLLTN